MIDDPSFHPVDDSRAISVPAELLQRAALQAHHADELRVVLLLLAATSDLDASTPIIGEAAFARSRSVLAAEESDGTPVPGRSWPWDAIEAGISHGLVVRFLDETTGAAWLMLNTVTNLKVLDQIRSGQGSLPVSSELSEAAPRLRIDQPTVFRLYEQNIGPLTPIIAERLIKATERYPAEWLESAFVEAVSYNRRNWRYIHRILENWMADGRTTGAR